MILLKRMARRARLELLWVLAMVIIFVVSLLLVVPSLFVRPLWKFQNRTVDWVDKWGLEPVRRHYFHASHGKR